MTQLLLVLGALLLTALAIGGVCWVIAGQLMPEPTAIQQRLTRIKTGEAAFADGPATMMGQPGKKQLTLDLGDNNQYRVEPFLKRYGLGRWLLSLIRESKIKVNLDRLFINWLGIPALMGIVLMGVVGSILPLFILGLVPILKVMLLVMARNKRLDALQRQLPDALIILASGMRAGHAFPSALQLTAMEAPRPLADELGDLSRDINLGMAIHESFAKLQQSVGYLPDFQLLATAVILQRETGGNLAEVLDQLSETIRERFKLQRQIASLTAQPRMTGYLLGGAPAILLAVLTLIFYSYVSALYETMIGNILLVVALVLQIIGFVVIRKLIDIKI